MSLAATLAAVQPNNIGGVCTIAKLIDTLPTADSIALHNALESPMQHVVIARALRAEGHDVSASTIRRHRAKDCKCL